MPSLQKITNWLFHLKTDQDAMAQQTGKPTHVILWRYKELKPLKKTLEKLGFKDFVVKKSKTAGTNLVEIYLPAGSELTKERLEQLRKKALEEKDNKIPPSHGAESGPDSDDYDNDGE